MSERSSRAKLPHSRKLERLVHEIVEEFTPSTVVLHGSAVKGTYVINVSDLDLAVVSPKFRGVDPKERFTRLLELAQRQRLRVEAFGYAPEEFLEMIEGLNFFVLDIVYYGMPLYDETGFWAKVRELFAKIKERYKLEKTETDGWTYTE